ncbi:DinB family protein [Tenacibaculum insulae]|uniref:DinB family protein n=1 Tax=Tenacibaculum insulae TaxID=2029677 RepID=UPI003AB4691F
MILKSEELINDLKKYVENHIAFVESIKNLTEEELQQKENKSSWSAVECIAHLNLYAEFYNPEIKGRIKKAKQQSNPNFKPGFLGNKFSSDMLPHEKMKTMNTFKSKNPIHSSLNTNDVLTRFIAFQKELLVLLELAKKVDLTKVKTLITLPLLKFRLGDTFRFTIYHNERHIVQAKKALN